MGFLFLMCYLLVAASNVSAEVKINNWCNKDIYVFQSNPGINNNCATGYTNECYVDPWRIPAGRIVPFDWIANNMGTSMQIGLGTDVSQGALQFEYTISPDGIYWDLSDLDGRGPGLVGTPFSHDNVKVSPTGAGAGEGTCVKIRCPANTLCVDSYQSSDEAKTRFCPSDTGDMWIDLCEPGHFFWNKREVSFVA